jgi:hypothetical protein
MFDKLILSNRPGAIAIFRAVCAPNSCAKVTFPTYEYGPIDW